MDFFNRKFLFNSNYCNSNCLVLPPSLPVIPQEHSLSNNESKIRIFTSLTISDNSKSSSLSNLHTHSIDFETLLKKFPNELIDYIDVFIKALSNVLPPHRPDDYEIKLKKKVDFIMVLSIM